MKKVLIAMSGGVDSSVAAWLLKEQGYECAGCTMKLYDNEDAGIPASRTCCSLDDVEDAKAVCRRLGIPHYTFNFSEEFREQVMGRFADCYARGRTPNPCIECNRCLKFGKLLERAEVLGCDYVATGHYARIDREEGKFRLRKAPDPGKDQSYVLYMLTQAQLSRVLFPLGSMRKDEVRCIAAEQGFLNAKKPDSQDICFVPDGDYAGFVERFTGKASEPGNFVDMDGRVLGRHRGIIHYTVGQRRGLGLAVPEPLYVCRLVPEENRVVLTTGKGLFLRGVLVRDVNWIVGEAPAEPLRCAVRIRYRHTEQPALVTALPGGQAKVLFDEPQRAVTPGQSAVFYDGETVLGGGEIVCGTEGDFQ